MAGLNNGVTGLSGASGLWEIVTGLWSGATGLQSGFAGGGGATLLEQLQAQLSGTDYALWLPATDSALDQTATPSVPVIPGSGDPVGYVEDLSGAGSHLTQGTTALKPDATQGLLGDGVDDRMDATFTFTPSTNMGLSYLMNVGGSNNIDLSIPSGTNNLDFGLYSKVGDANAGVGRLGSLGAYADGVDISAYTRAQVNTNIFVGTWKIITLFGNWSSYPDLALFGRYCNGLTSPRVGGNFAGLVLWDETAVSARTNAEALLAEIRDNL